MARSSYWQDVVKSCTFLTVLAGSRSRGLHASQQEVDEGRAVKVSDYDMRSVFDWPDAYRYTLGEKPPATVTMPGEDYVAFELMKFMHLLYDASAEHHEMLWSPVDFSGTSLFGTLLRQVRHKLTSKQLVKQLLGGAGFASVETVNDYMATGKSLVLESGGAGMLGRAVRYRQQDDYTARKALTDSVRRLMVAYHMMQPFEPQESVVEYDSALALKLAPGKSWDYAVTSYNSYLNLGMRLLQWDAEDDGRYYVQLPDTERNLLREFRYGTDDTHWNLMLDYRNDLFTAVQSLMATTKLREKPDPVWGAMFLKMFTEGRTQWHSQNNNTNMRHVSFYTGDENHDFDD